MGEDRIIGVMLSSIGLVFIPSIAVFFLAGTLFDIRRLRQNPWPLLWYFEVGLVLISVLIVNLLGIENIPIFFKAIPGTETQIAFIVLATLFAYVICLGFFLRLFGLRLVISSKEDIHLQRDKIKEWGVALIILGCASILIFHLLRYEHALLSAVFTGQSLLRIRLANKYSGYVPSQIASMLPLIGYLVAVLGGLLARRKRIMGFVYLLFALLFLSAPGDKAPPLWGIIIWLMAQGRLVPRKLFSLRTLCSGLLGGAVILGILYQLLSLQVPSLTLEKFSLYLLQRLGVGQIVGVYETFGLAWNHSLPEGEFYWHMIPGASLVIDYMDYQKVLMIATEGYAATEMGVKNSLFIAEAFAIGGLPMLLLSPIIVAFSTALGLRLLKDAISRVVGRKISPGLAMVVYLKTHAITGGFASFPLLKGLLLVLIQLMIIWFFSFMIAKLLRVLKIRQRYISSMVRTPRSEGIGNPSGSYSEVS